MRILHLKISNCGDCPYKEYDAPSDYGEGGYMCDHGDRYQVIVPYREYQQLRKEHDGPIVGKDYPPDWCPLPEV